MDGSDLHTVGYTVNYCARSSYLAAATDDDNDDDDDNSSIDLSRFIYRCVMGYSERLV